jgi:hypothetical protein
MSPKEVEHWLIENDFKFRTDLTFPYWEYKNGGAGVSDKMVQEDPKQAIGWVRQQLVRIGEAPRD